MRNACEGKPRQTWRQGDSAESHTVGGAICIGSRSTDVGSGQLKNPRGYPFKCLTCQTTEKDSCQSGPLVPDVLNERKDQPRSPSDYQLLEARKDSNRTVAPAAEDCVPAELMLPVSNPSSYATSTLSPHWEKRSCQKLLKKIIVPYLL